MDNKHLEIEEIIKLFHTKTSNKVEFNAKSVVIPISSVDLRARSSMAAYALLVKGGAGA